MFFRVSAGLVLPSGRIVVAEGGSNSVRLFSPEGIELRRVGREGEGPEEYVGISHLFMLPGDSMGVFSWPSKLTVLDEELNFVRTLRLPELIRNPRVLESGDIIAMRMFPTMEGYDFAEGDQLIRPDVQLLRVSSVTGEIDDTVWRGPGFEEYAFVWNGEPASSAPLFGKTLAYTTRGNEVVVGTGDDMSMEVLDSEGSLMELIQVEDYNLSLTDEEVSQEREAWLGDSPSARLRAQVGRLPAPEKRPAYSDLMVDQQGYIWAKEARTMAGASQPTRWEIFGPQGRWLGHFVTPARFQVLELGQDYILGVQSDELDVERVILLDLRRRVE